MVSAKETGEVVQSASQRLVLLPVESGVLFPECQSSVVVAEESGLDAVRYVQGEQIPLFGFCTYTNPGDEGSVRLEDSDDDDATLQAIGTMALLRDVEFSEEESAEGARCTCVGVQRFRIVRMESLEPFPVAQVELFNDMKVGEEEIASMAKLETEANTAAEEVLKLSEKLVSEDNAAESQTVHEAFMRVRKFAPEGPGTSQLVVSPIGELVGWKLSESERLELQSFALADIHDIPEAERYSLLCAVSTRQRLEATHRDFCEAAKELAAKVALKQVALD